MNTDISLDAERELTDGELEAVVGGRGSLISIVNYSPRNFNFLSNNNNGSNNIGSNGNGNCNGDNGSFNGTLDGNGNGFFYVTPWWP